MANDPSRTALALFPGHCEACPKDAELAAKAAMDLSKRTGAELLGSVSNKVLRAASGPVLVCPRRAPNGA